MSHCYSSGTNSKCMDQSTSYQAFKNSSFFNLYIIISCVREANLITQDRERNVQSCPWEFHQRYFKTNVKKGLTTTENTITYHYALCFLPQNFAWALFSVSLGATSTPKRNWRQCLRKILGWQTNSIMVCYGSFCSGQLNSRYCNTLHCLLCGTHTWTWWRLKQAIKMCGRLRNIN